MQFVPWKHISDWKCIGCGDCCRLYSVVINFHEWLKIVKNYGVEHTASGLDKLFINRRSDGSCAFLSNCTNIYLCALQHMKPKACQLWPFKILMEPKFGYPNEAAYLYGRSRLFVYADPMCSGLKFGAPTWEFTNLTVKEFVEIATGQRSNQSKTTSSLWVPGSYASFRV
jgi:Fe-S-cluster containining protein